MKISSRVRSSLIGGTIAIALTSALFIIMCCNANGADTDTSRSVDVVETLTTSADGLVTTTNTPTTTKDTTTTTTNTPTTTSTAVESTTTVVETTVATVETVVATTVETQPAKSEPVREYVVYKPSTHYIHKNTCRWCNSECYEISSTEGLEARKCTECNPDMEIVTPYVAPIPTLSSDVYYFQGTYYSGRSMGYTSPPKGASGATLTSGYSVASNYFAYGTRLWIESDYISGEFIVQDCGGMAYNVIDFYYWSNSDVPSAFAYAGRIPITVTVIE